MEKLADLLRLGEDLVGFADEPGWLQTLAQLGEHWRKIADELKARFDNVEIHSAQELFAFLRDTADTLETGPVGEAFDKLGLSDLRAKLVEFAGIYDRLPEEVKRLASPLSQFVESAKARDYKSDSPIGYRDDWTDGVDPGAVKLPIPTLSVKHGTVAGKADFSFNLGAKAILEAEAGALWPYARDKVDPGLLQLTFAGSIDAGANGKLPFQSGKVEAHAAAGARAGLMFFHRPAGTESIYAIELANFLTHLPNPFAFASVWNAMDEHGLEGMIATLDGHAEVAVEVSVGKSLDLPKVLSGKLGFTGKVSLKRKAGYILSVRSAGTGAGKRALRVALSRNKSAADSWGLGLGLELDISPLVDRVHDVLEDVLEEWTKELGKLKPFLKPGTWIRTELKGEFEELITELIDDPALKEGLTQDLGLLAETSDVDDSALFELLAEKLRQKLENVGELAFGKVENEAGKVVDQIAGWLPTLAAGEARELLQGKVETLIGGFQARLKSELERISASVDPKDVGKALKSAGLKIDKAITTADGALAGLRKLIERFDAILHDAVAKTEDAAIRKIGAQLSFEDSRETEFDMEFVGIFTADSSQTQALYSSMIQGKLAPLQNILLGKTKVDGFELEPDQSSIRRFTRVGRKVGYAFVGFGIESTASEIISGEAEIVVTGNGDIKLSAKADFEKHQSGPRESRSATFVSTYGLLAAKAEDDGGNGRERNLQQSISLEITASHRDEALTVGDVSGFLDGLAALGLVRPDRIEAAKKIYEGWSLSGGNDAKHPPGDIEVKMSLDRLRLDVLLGLGKRITADFTAKSLADTATRLVMGQGLSAMLASARLSRDELFKVIDKARARDFGPPDSTLTREQWLMLYTHSARVAGGSSIEKHHRMILRADVNDDAQYNRIMVAMLSLSALADIFQLMFEIYDARPDGLDGKDGWTDKEYAEREQMMAGAAGDWIGLGSKWIFWFRQGMSPKTAAFMVVLVALSSGCSVDEVIAGHLGDPLFKISMTKRFGLPGEQVPINI